MPISNKSVGQPNGDVETINSVSPEISGASPICKVDPSACAQPLKQESFSLSCESSSPSRISDEQETLRLLKRHYRPSCVGCIGAGYVGGPTMAMIAYKCPDILVL